MKFAVERPIALVVMLGSVMLAGSAQSQAQSTDPNTYLYIAHAASGRAMSSTANPALPVDISVDGNCIAKGISYGELRGPFSGPAGTYTFQVSKADSATPCSGATVFSTVVPLSAANTFIGVLSLDASNNLTGLLYTADLSSVPAGLARFEIINATQNALNASVTIGGDSQGVAVAPGTIQEGLQIPGTFPGSITDVSNNVVAGPFTVEFEQRNVYVYVLAGSVDNQSVQVIGPKVIEGVF